NSYQSAPLTVAPEMVALFHLDANLADATGQHGSLALTGNATLDDSNLGWPAVRQGAALQALDLGDTAIFSIPRAELRPTADTAAVVLEVMVYVASYDAYNRDSVPIISLYDTWNAFLEFGEDKYAGPFVRGGTQMEVMGTTLTSVLAPKIWHHLALEINQQA